MEKPIKLTQSEKPAKPHKTIKSGWPVIIFIICIIGLITLAIALPIALSNKNATKGGSGYSGGYYPAYYTLEDESNKTLSDIVTQNHTKNDIT